jgi:hypothetical protein
VATTSSTLPPFDAASSSSRRSSSGSIPSKRFYRSCTCFVRATLLVRKAKGWRKQAVGGQANPVRICANFRVQVLGCIVKRPTYDSVQFSSVQAALAVVNNAVVIGTAEVSGWVRNNPNATPQQFENYLRQRYSQPDLQNRFPNGL